MIMVGIGGGCRTGRGQANHTSPGHGGRPHWRGKPGRAMLPGRLCLCWKQEWCRQVRPFLLLATWLQRMAQDCARYGVDSCCTREAGHAVLCCLAVSEFFRLQRHARWVCHTAEPLLTERMRSSVRRSKAISEDACYLNASWGHV